MTWSLFLPVYVCSNCGSVLLYFGTGPGSARVCWWDDRSWSGWVRFDATDVPKPSLSELFHCCPRCGSQDAQLVLKAAQHSTAVLWKPWTWFAPRQWRVKT